MLSLALPVPLLAMLYFVARRDLMGELVCGPVMLVCAGAATAVVLTLNVTLLLQLAGVDLALLF